MDYACDVVDRPAQAALVVRTRAAVDQLPQVLGPAWGHVLAHAKSVGAHPSGPPFVAYHNADMRNLQIDVGFAFDRPLEGGGDVHSSEIPAGLAAETVHVGPYDRLRAAYAALEAWMKATGHAPAGPAYEYYLNDPQETPPDELRTRIVMAVAVR